MRNLSDSLRTLRSKRALVALGGIAAITFGVTNTVGTQAATQDTGIATASQIASQNYYPVPVSTSVSCSTSGTAGINRRANLSWPSAGTGFKYSVEQWKDNNTYKWSTTVSSPSYSGFYSGYIGSDRVRIYSINPTTTEKSTGYVSASVYSPLSYDSYCTGTYGQENVTCWQQQTSWTPGQSTSNCSGGTVDPQNLVVPQQQQLMRAPATTTTDPYTTTTTTTDRTSTATTTTDPSTTTSSPTTTTSTTPTTTTTTTTTPSTTRSTAPTTTTATTSSQSAGQ